MNRSQKPYIILSQSLPILRGWAIVWIVAFHLLGNTQGHHIVTDTMSSFSQGGLENIVEAHW